jgi:hypothetical protein
MKKKSLFAAAAVLCLSTTAFAQNNGTIGVYTDAVGSSCCLTIGAGTMGVVHIVVTLAGATGGGGPIMGGITGAEFRLLIPNQSGYFMNWVADPAFNTVLGNPVDVTPADDDYGVTMASGGCLPMGGGMVGDKVPLGTITIFNAAGGPTPIHVLRKRPPSNITLRDCPLLVLCDSPVFTTACVGSMAGSQIPEPIHFAAQLNVAGCGATTCGPVAVEPVNWTAVKSLFR